MNEVNGAFLISQIPTDELTSSWTQSSCVAEPKMFPLLTQSLIMRLREDFAGCNIFCGSLYRSFAVVQVHINSKSLLIFRLHPVSISELRDWYRVQTFRTLFSRHSLTLCSTNGAEGISESYLVHLLAPGGSIPVSFGSSLEVPWGTHNNLHIPTVLIHLKLTC